MAQFVICNIKESYDGVIETVSGVKLYPSREYPGLGPDDCLWLPSALEGELGLVQRHYRRAGISSLPEVVFADDWRTIDFGEFSEYQIRPFMMDRTMALWTGERRWHGGFSGFEDKEWFARFCMASRIPTPRTFFSQDVLTQNVFEGVGEEGLLMKLVWGATGIGIETVRDMSELQAWHERAGYKPFLLQEKIDKVLELGTQIDLDGDTPVVVAVTGQHIAPGNSHEGNFMPFSAEQDLPINMQELTACTLRAACAMKRAGLKGRVGIDVLVAADGSWFFSETNARRTGATPYIDLARKMGVSAWSSKNLLTTARSIRELGLENNPLCYTPARGEGIVVVNWGPVSAGKLGVLFIGPPEKWAEMERDTRDFLESDIEEARQGQKQGSQAEAA